MYPVCEPFAPLLWLWVISPRPSTLNFSLNAWLWIRMQIISCSESLIRLVKPSCWLSFLSPHLYSKQRMQSDKRERKKEKKLFPPIHSSLSSQPPTLPSHLPFSHSDSYWNPSEPPLSLSLPLPPSPSLPASPTPPLSFVFSLPLIAKLARNAMS